MLFWDKILPHLKQLILSTLLLLSAYANAQYTNLVLEGGGLKGLAYTGAIEVLDSMGITQNIENVAGTSSGSMNALLIALGYSGNEIKHINLETNFGRYNQVGVPMISGIARLRKSYGYYKTDRFVEDLGKLITAKGYSVNLTFDELYQAKMDGKNVKLLYITGTNLTDQRVEIFSHKTYPSMRILDAVRISISIPFYFEAVFMQPDGSLIDKKKADSSTKVMVDGGVLDNYPFYIFDTLTTVNNGANSYYKCNLNTLGLKLELDSSRIDIAPKSVKKYSDFLTAFSYLSSEYLNRRHLGKEQKCQTIFINTQGFNPKVRKLSKQKKIAVMSYGKAAALYYFSHQY